MLYLILNGGRILLSYLKGSSSIDLSSLVMLILIDLMWAGSFIAIKVGLREIPPSTMALLRFSLAFPLLAVFLFFVERDKLRVDWKGLPHLIVLSLTGVTFLYIFQFYSLKYITASAGAILINTTTIFIALLSAAFLGEALSKVKGLGIGSAFLGTFLIVSEGNLNIFSLSFLEVFGALLMIGAALCWAVYSVLGKITLQAYSPMMVTTMVFGLGAMFLVPPSLAESPATFLFEISWLGWFSVLYLAVFASAVCYLLWSKVLLRIDATKAAVFLYLIPPLTLIFSFFLLEEAITYPILVGMVLVIGGVYLTQRT
jgi:drug/metabolite transporter (DMT)-like permease